MKERCRGRGRGGFIGEFGAGRGTAETKEIGKRRGDGGIIPTVNKFAHTRAGRVKLKYFEG